MGEHNYKGLGVALVTPFLNNGEIDFISLEKIINFQVNNKVDYLVVLGTTGETATLSNNEKQNIFEFVAEKANGKIKLVAGIGGNNTNIVIETIKNFNIEGYSAILSVAPYYNKPSQAGLLAHYQALNAITHLPIIMYNVPGRTGMNITAETTLKIASTCSNIIATKEASGNMEQIMEIIANKPDSFSVISGDDVIALPLMASGAVGLISVAGNAYPLEMSKMIHLCLNEKYKDALVIHNKILAKINTMFADGNPSGIKQYLANMELCLPNCRLPIVGVSNELKEKIKTLTSF